MNQIYDCFVFFDELDLLEIRLNTLDSVVDKFVLVEGEKTFQKNLKPLTFWENRMRFEKFLHKIIHIVVPQEEFVTGHNSSWLNERHSFNCILRGIPQIEQNDIILVSAVDEIPNPNVISHLRNQEDITPCHVGMVLYHYYFNTRFRTKNAPEFWAGTFISSFKYVKEYEDLYKCAIIERGKLPMLENCGWHFSYLGTAKNINKKINSFAHDEYKEEINEDIIETNKQSLGDPLNRTNASVYATYFEGVESLDNLPKYIQDNHILYKDYIYKNVLVIGGNGYIGSRLYEYLKLKKYSVANVDLGLYEILYPETLKVNYHFLNESFLHKFTHIILLAGCSSVGTSKNTAHTINSNVTYFNNLVNKLLNTQTLIYASSCSVYGSSDELLTENDKLSPPLNNYDFSKQCIDYINQFSDKKCVGLRFGTVSGYSPNLRKDLIINSMTFNSIDGKIFVSNGDVKRSILGLSDLCRAIEALVQAPTIPNKIYNLVSFSSTVLEIGQKIKQLSDAQLEVNNALQTSYSFNVSNELFEKDFNFKFADSIESIYNELIRNRGEIRYQSTRYEPHSS